MRFWPVWIQTHANTGHPLAMVHRQPSDGDDTPNEGCDDREPPAIEIKMTNAVSSAFIGDPSEIEIIHSASFVAEAAGASIPLFRDYSLSQAKS
jgi:hypothetical protein